MNTERPFQRSYWAIPEQLLGGCYPGDQDSEEMKRKLAGLVGAGVTLVINLMEEQETNRAGQPFVDYGPLLDRLASEQKRAVRRERFPIRDMSIPSRVEMQAILKAVHLEIDAGGVVYVHCWGGRGRTGTVIGCYLLEHGLVTLDTVLGRLKSLTDHAAASFQPTPQTPEQREFVLSWRSSQP